MINIQCYSNSSHFSYFFQAHLKTDHSQLIIDWVGEGSNVVVSLSRDANINNESVSDIFISFDYGHTFKKQTNLFKLDDDKLAIIDYFYKNEKFPSRVSEICLLLV